MPTRPTGTSGNPDRAGTGMLVRARTITGGVALAAVLLLGWALIGGVGDPPARPERAAPGHPGRLTAIQPQLRQALLTGDEVSRVDPPATPGGARAEPPAAAEPPADPPAPAPTGLRELGELCRALLEDPTGVPALWGATPPQEVTSQQTRRRRGAELHQLLGVFDAGQAPAAYERLREAATGCHRLPVTLSDGTPVVALLRELATTPAGAASRPESATVPAEQGYAVAITVEGERGARTGWLALDRVGPVISVLRQLGPLTRSATSLAGAELAPTRRAALGKLRPVLELLRDRRGGAG